MLSFDFVIDKMLQLISSISINKINCCLLQTSVAWRRLQNYSIISNYRAAIRNPLKVCILYNDMPTDIIGLNKGIKVMEEVYETTILIK